MSPRILVVEDHENQRRTLAIGLRLEGFDVGEAKDGEMALECLAASSFEVALIDLMMPGINGLELARRLRCSHPDVRIVLTSAYHLTERQLERAGLGPIAFVAKPYDMAELVGFLRIKAASVRPPPPGPLSR